MLCSRTLTATALLFLCPVALTQAERSKPGFDPLLDQAMCTSAQGGRPPLLAMLAQTETAPFRATQQDRKPAADGDPPLYDNLGTLHLRISTASPKAQAYFDQGLRLVFAFNHAEAARAFRAAQRHDPGCAMCYWGEALVLGPNINAPMFPEAVAPAAAAAASAQSRAARATPPEQALIRAIGQRYQAAPPADRAPLDQAYARTACPTPSRPTGTTRCASRWARRCCAWAGWTRPKRPSAPPSRARPATAGRCAA